MTVRSALSVDLGAVTEQKLHHFLVPIRKYPEGDVAQPPKTLHVLDIIANRKIHPVR
jgi:hypothetical protein